jgi:hypothetical protein
MHTHLREHYYILIVTNHLRLNILGFSLLLTIDDLRIYFNSVLFSFTTYFSTFLSRVCLKLTFLCATIIVNSTTSFILQRIKTFLFYWRIASLYCSATRPFTQASPTVTLKEVIRPQVPLRPPCYDFSLVADPRFDNANAALPRQEPTSMKRRAVCARSRDVFTAR